MPPSPPTLTRRLTYRTRNRPTRIVAMKTRPDLPDPLDLTDRLDLLDQCDPLDLLDPGSVSP